MPSHRHAVALALALWPARALADVAPPPGYVETCSVEKQRRSGEDCVSCSTYFAQADACQKQYAGRGYALRCRTRGASTWSEVWCKSSSAVAVTSMGEERDAATPGPSEPVPAPSALGSAAPSAAPTTTPTPSAGAAPTNDAPTPPAPAMSATETPAVPATRSEKGGSCGACELGRRSSDRLPLGWLALATLLGVARRRRRRLRSASDRA